MYVVCWQDDNGSHWEVVESVSEAESLTGSNEYLIFNREDALEEFI